MLLSILSVISFLTCADSDESVELSILNESLPFYFFSPLKILGLLHGTHPTGLAKKNLNSRLSFGQAALAFCFPRATSGSS